MAYMSDSHPVNIQPGLVMTDDTPHLAAGMLACIINGLNAVLASECWLEVVIIRFLAQPSPAQPWQPPGNSAPVSTPQLAEAWPAGARAPHLI